jgi:hypothetical protein
MKRTSLRLLAVFLAAATLLPGALAAGNGFTSIFNGRDLSGWEGLNEFWSVRDGAITGQTTVDRMLKANTFLVWKGGEPANFELRAQFRLLGNNEKNQANSGVQYRSRILDPSTYVVGGYQADIDMGRYIGMLYEEKGRGILMQPGQRIRVSPPPAAQQKGRQKAKIETVATVTTPEEIAAAYQLGEWNEITIVARGNRLQHFINGKLTADVTDLDPEKGAKSGVIALQLHVGPPMTIQFKNVRLKTLP